MNPRITALADKPGEQVGISAERLDTLEADVIVFATEKPSDIAELGKTPTFGKLDAVAETARSTRRDAGGRALLHEPAQPGLRARPARAAAPGRARREGAAEGRRHDHGASAED